MATLRINLSAVGNACDQDSTPAGHWPANGWYVFLHNCKNQPYVKAGKQYSAFPVDHGYVEIKDVPPGRYIVFAIVNPFPVGRPIPGGELIFQSNFVSHFAIVEVCCNCEDLCVTLYNSGWHYCVQVVLYWFELLAQTKQLDTKITRPAIEAMRAAIGAGGKTLPGDAAALEQIAKIMADFQRGERREP